MAIVRVPDHEQLADVVTAEIGGLPGVTRTQTMVAFAAYSRHDLERCSRSANERSLDSVADGIDPTEAASTAPRSASCWRPAGTPRRGSSRRIVVAIGIGLLALAVGGGADARERPLLPRRTGAVLLQLPRALPHGARARRVRPGAQSRARAVAQLVRGGTAAAAAIQRRASAPSCRCMRARTSTGCATATAGSCCAGRARRGSTPCPRTRSPTPRRSRAARSTAAISCCCPNGPARATVCTS